MSVIEVAVGVGAEVEARTERGMGALEVETVALVVGNLEVGVGVSLIGQEVPQWEVTDVIVLAVEVFRQTEWKQMISSRLIRCLVLGHCMQAVFYSYYNYCFFLGPSNGCVFQAFNCWLSSFQRSSTNGKSPSFLRVAGAK